MFLSYILATATVVYIFYESLLVLEHSEMEALAAPDGSGITVTFSAFLC